jgi:NTP pyrophosphatase (non-canonical NTP hydrolase)
LDQDKSVFSEIDEYYVARHYVMPDKEEALAFFLSEVGELCEAWLNDHPETPLAPILKLFIEAGVQADTWVSDRKGWVRNGDRVKKSNIADEIGDTFMMLYIFCGQIRVGPFEVMVDKFRRKLGKDQAEQERSDSLVGNTGHRFPNDRRKSNGRRSTDR